MSSQLKNAIRDTFDAVAVEMEGAALAQVCKMNRVPFLVIRTVSDNADEEAIGDFDRFIEAAGIRDYEILKNFL